MYYTFIISILLKFWSPISDHVQELTIDKFIEYKKVDTFIDDKKFKIHPYPDKTVPDLDILQLLIKGNSILQNERPDEDMIDAEYLDCTETIRVPKELNKKCLSKKDFIGWYYCPVIVGQFQYVELKFKSKNNEVIYFFGEFDLKGNFVKHYYKYIIS